MYRFGTTWGWINDHRVFIRLMWLNLYMKVFFCLSGYDLTTIRVCCFARLEEVSLYVRDLFHFKMITIYRIQCRQAYPFSFYEHSYATPDYLFWSVTWILSGSLYLEFDFHWALCGEWIDSQMHDSVLLSTEDIWTALLLDIQHCVH